MIDKPELLFGLFPMFINKKEARMILFYCSKKRLEYTRKMLTCSDDEYDDITEKLVDIELLTEKLRMGISLFAEEKKEN